MFTFDFADSVATEGHGRTSTGGTDNEASLATAPLSPRHETSLLALYNNARDETTVVAHPIVEFALSLEPCGRRDVAPLLASDFLVTSIEVTLADGHVADAGSPAPAVAPRRDRVVDSTQRTRAAPGVSGGLDARARETDCDLRLLHRKSVTNPALQGDDRRDIVPRVYLGGFKLWSCSSLLASVLTDLYCSGARSTSSGDANSRATTNTRAAAAAYVYELLSQRTVSGSRRVLEFGCGHGLPGMAALLLSERSSMRSSPGESSDANRGIPSMDDGSAITVTFHDYNAEVLQQCVLPNVCATGCAMDGWNKDRDDVSAAARRLAKRAFAAWGDWRAFVPNAYPGRGDGCSACYHLALGSDVTYDDEACDGAVAFLDRVVLPGGMALIATKHFYFGTGGGAQRLTSALQQRGWSVSVVYDDEAHQGLQRCVVCGVAPAATTV